MCSYSHISMIPFLFWPFTLPFLLAYCVSGSQKSGRREVSAARSTVAITPVTSCSIASSESEIRSKSEKSERSVRSLRSTANDSLKEPRKKVSSRDEMSISTKSLKKSQSSKSRKVISSDTDSAKTELIEVPLGKAAKEWEGKRSEQKSVSISSQLPHVTFASSLKRLKRRGTKPDDDDEKTKYIP